MAITTFDRAQTLGGTSNTTGFARRLFDRFIEAQTAKARLRVNAYLQSLDDQALARLGYTPADISNIRRSKSNISAIV